jgi:CheY-like chemotaxis protein
MSLKVLIIEDDPVILDLMGQTFTAAGMQVRPLQDSQSAADIIETEGFDGIFLDLEMPNVHGFQIIRYVRKSSRNRSTPIIVVTGCADRTALEQSFGFGATFFLHKPIDTLRLLRLFRTVHGALVHRRHRFIRVPFRTDVVCHQRNTTVTRTSVNLSQGGILLQDINLPVGEELRLSFRSPITNALITASGNIVRLDEGQNGAIQFTRLDNASRDQIRQVIRQFAI